MRMKGGHASGRSASRGAARTRLLLPAPPEAPNVRGKPAPFRAWAGTPGKCGRQPLRVAYPQPPALRDEDSAEPNEASLPAPADLPSASAPAFRRFRVTGDAEPPGLAHQNIMGEEGILTFPAEYFDMKENLVGHITSNPNKIKVLEILRRKEGVNEKTVSKFTRIPVIMLKGTIEELKKDGVIEERDGGLYLTELGIEVLTSLKGI